MEKVLILGASRGLGRAVVDEISQRPFDLYLMSRKQMNFKSDFKSMSVDVSKEHDQDQIFNEILSFQPHRILNFIGAGPYGKYESKAWKDHRWAFEVSFLFSAKLLHFVLSQKPTQLRQILFTGSSVAEASPDPMAASYSAAKHALLGLVSSVVNEHPGLDIRLFSPGYMDTEMLPDNAWPRQQKDVKIHQPKDTAKQLVSWILSPADDRFHLEVQ
jgi:short-subunit dehydrogenase